MKIRGKSVSTRCVTNAVICVRTPGAELPCASATMSDMTDFISRILEVIGKTIRSGSNMSALGLILQALTWPIREAERGR